MKKEILIVIMLFSFFLSMQSREPEKNEQIIANLYYDKIYHNFTIKMSESKDENSIAYAIYNKSYERTGWDFLSISTYDKNDSKYPDIKKAYAMGYLEGYLTKDRIDSYFTNMLHYDFSQNNLTIPEELKRFYKTNIDYMVQNCQSKKDNDIYWEYVYYIYQQLEGLYDGYISRFEGDKTLDFYEFLLLPTFADTGEILKYLNLNKLNNFEAMNVNDIQKFILLNSYCSALIKLADDYSDIWFGHNTWHTYTSMIRIFKEYRFISNKGEEKSKTIAFSSYPATLASLDDFYFLESKLLVMETTNPIFDKNLYKKVNPNALLTWVRVMVANRLASSAEYWTNIFKKENSGTYNNQFMILDINNINLKNKIIPDKSLMIIEQIPGETEVNDVTEQLKKGYWPSYNVPYSKNIYEKSGYIEKLNKKPELIYNIDYDNCSRAQIFKRDQNKIKSSNDFKKMLRYNDYKNDNLSNNNSLLVIAARADLIDSDCYGATDVKFISVKELLEGKFYAHIISGPTNEQQPTFSWKDTKCYEEFPDKYYHEGLVETWNFDWIDYNLQLFANQNNNDINNTDNNNTDNSNNTPSGDSNPHEDDDDDNNNKILIISLSVAGGVILIMVIIIIVTLKYRNSKDKINEAVNQISFIDQDKYITKEENDDYLE